MSTKTKAKKRKTRIKKQAPQLTMRKGSKGQAIVRLLRRKLGASVSDIERATGWKPGTIRAYFRNELVLRRGLTVETFMRGVTRHYRLT